MLNCFLFFSCSILFAFDQSSFVKHTINTNQIKIPPMRNAFQTTTTGNHHTMSNLLTWLPNSKRNVFYINFVRPAKRRVPVPGETEWHIFTHSWLLQSRKNNFFNTCYRVCDTTVGCLFMFECSQLEPDLSNSFLYILLANNTVSGVVGLGYIDRPGRCRNINTHTKALIFGPLTVPYRDRV